MNTTIIILAHKDRGYLHQCIQSCIDQGEGNQLILAIDGNEKLNEYAKKYNIIHTISYMGGVAASFNQALKQAKKKYVKYVCDDDFLTKDSIKTCENNINDYDFLHANAINFYLNNQIVYKPGVTQLTFKDLLSKNYIHGASTFYRLDALQKVGGMNPLLKAGEEYDMHLKMLKAGMKLGYIDYETAYYRQHKSQKSHKRNREKRRIIIDGIKAAHSKNV